MRAKIWFKAGSPPTVLVVFSVLLLGTLAFGGEVSVPIERLTESVKGMLDDGFSNQEIINAIKSELSLSRIKGLIGRMYEGEELSEDEITRMRSGEINDDDDELKSLLQGFGIELRNGTIQEPKENFQQDKYEWEGGSDDVDVTFNSMKDHGSLMKDLLGEIKQKQDHLKAKSKPDYAYSPYDLFGVVKIEELIYKPLKRYIRKVEARLKLLKSLTKDIEDSSGLITKVLPANSKLEERAAAIVSNPLASYKLIKRFAIKLPDVWSAAGEDYEEELWSELSKIRITRPPPNEQDWKEAIGALLRIQYFNGYKAEEFAEGILGQVKHGVKFSAQECMEIGLRALALKQYDLALEWLHLSKRKAWEEKENGMDKADGVDLGILKQSLDYAVQEHNAAWEAYQGYGKPNHFTTRIKRDEDIKTAVKMSSLLRNESKIVRTHEDYDVHIHYNFISLCAGENLQTEKEKSRLYCWLERSKNPYFYISPMKMELLSEEPPLVQIYDVIGDKMINKVKQNAIKKLERSQVINYNDPMADDVSLSRTSSQMWMSSHAQQKSKDFENLSKLIEKVTGLHTRKWGSSEDFQIACYGTSHHYEEHLDAVQDSRRTSLFGERIATFMLYLSDVAQGGKTAFPVLGTAANSVKGSAVFWYNLKKNGEPDKRTWHGGCSVVEGIKWVMNNWILLYENMQNRPCGLRPED